MADFEDDRVNDIAVIGMAGRFPGANNLDEYWRNLRDGVEAITFFSDEELLEAGIAAAVLNNPRYVKAAPLFPHHPGLFDAAFFGFTPRDAERTDPQHRILLECAWEALEHAGYDPAQCGGRIGIFAGSSLNTYLLFNLAAQVSASEGFQTLIRNDKDYLTTNISYKLNLSGPSIAVQTACSTGLVAVHLGCQSLLNRECEIALAGGVRVVVPQSAGYLHEQGGVFSSDGHCRAFDHKADGTIFGSGAGLVVLKRFEDAVADRDEIHAVVKGSAVNNDGALKVGFTAPGFDGQTKVIAEALATSGVAPGTIGYVEAHGTGTSMGDPLEIAALTRAFGLDGPVNGRCGIGSVKSNIGHLEAAAGIAGLIKTVLALKHRTLPPTLHVEQTNPHLDLGKGPFYVNTNSTPWPATGSEPRRAGVNSFGIGGTNVHAILEEAPPADRAASARGRQLLVLSAQTPSALDAVAANLLEHLRQHADLNLADAAYTLQVGRRALSHRRVLVCRDVADAIAVLAANDPTRVITSSGAPRARSVVWMFPGQGAQRVNMLRDVYRDEPLFRASIDRCSTLLIRHLGVDLRSLIYVDGADAATAAGKLEQTAFAQPAIFATEYALAQLWTSWGVRPQAMIGHSIGEYVAACLAGVFSLEDALGLVAARGRLMQDLPAGAMLAVPLPERELAGLLGDDVALAAINAPALCTATGTVDGITALGKRLAGRGVESRVLHTSHAFHSPMMDPIASRYLERVCAVRLQPPRMPFVSNLTGTWIRDDEATDPSYWVRHLRQTVRFADGLTTVLQTPDAILMELGPGHTLGTFARQHPARSADQAIVSSAGHATATPPDGDSLMTALGKLWLLGTEITWTAVHKPEQRRRMSLPTYPFERKRYWIEGPRSKWRGGVERQGTAVDADDGRPLMARAPAHDRPPLQTAYEEPRNELERVIAGIWQDGLGIQRVGRGDNFFELGGHSLLALSLLSRLQDALQLDIQLDWLPEAATVAQLAACIEAAREGGPGAPAVRSPLVAIQPAGANHPFFCVHPNAGKLTGFLDLARHLGVDQPFYGLQATALDDGDSGRGSIAQMAAHNIEAMRSVQPHGPYVLGGYSFGGIVAFEMARQLENDGQRVALLALLDSMPLPRDVSAAGLPDERVLLAWFAWEMGRVYRRDLGVSFTTLLELDTDSALRHLLERAGALDLASSDRSFAEVKGLFRLFCASIQALWEHVPGGYPYPANIHVFRALDTFGGEFAHALPTPVLRHILDLHVADSTYGWGALTSTRPIVHMVTGNHYSMLNDPHVRLLGGQLRREIARVSRRPGRESSGQANTPSSAASRISLAEPAVPAVATGDQVEKTEKGASMIDRDLVGTWKLLSWELRTSRNDVVLHPFGEAVGYVIYSDNGYMSLSIMKVNRSRASADNPLVASTEEHAAAAESYFSYCGRYEARAGTVVHHIEAGLFPNWVGESQERRYTLDNDRLSLAVPAAIAGLELAHHLEWERVR